MDAPEFVRAVMQRLEAGSPAELADRMRWKRGMERTISRWLAGQTTPRFDYVMEMVERSGLLNKTAERPKEERAVPGDPLAALARSVGELAATQAAIADALGVPRADIEIPEDAPLPQQGKPTDRRKRAAR